MDITSRRPDSKVDVQVTSDVQIATSKTIKRSFDVAFLMLPDDKLKQKQLKASEIAYQENNNVENAKNDTDSDDSSKAVELQKMKTHARYLQNAIHKQQVFGDPNLKSKLEFDSAATLKLLPHIHHSEQKSAFTKVNLAKDSRTSPSLSASPDINYQSLSPSPPIMNRNYQLHPNILTPNQIFKPAYQNNFIPENFANPNPIVLDHPFLTKNPSTDLLQPSFAKMRPMLGQYRHELSYNYPQFQPPEMLKIAQPDLKFSSGNPAAAILSTLLPPSLAALSLPAQNICAKCNVSFRMTSDLVYHMRSHHKNDTVDVTKKRREDKLKCPVCAESFRERHHLTRHMTAHQDKEDDEEEPIGKKKEFANFTK
ncbi:hypothetical protein PPYR_08252 [Photinus pyralis]|uniref:C2H2-type domain-containing protein n=2 Tax=Photinus pyralis TaxID=7054 RepID=A0A5N4AJ71_PHOPY|nr:hypothetical protein PPYR_03741 [Photinus pyralis]KAB0797258.1 hypothetical protein PPYR_08252 [Photinus pyralis]